MTANSPFFEFLELPLMYLRAENSPNIKALKEVLLQKSFK